MARWLLADFSEEITFVEITFECNSCHLTGTSKSSAMSSHGNPVFLVFASEPLFALKMNETPFHWVQKISLFSTLKFLSSLPMGNGFLGIREKGLVVCALHFPSVGKCHTAPRTQVADLRWETACCWWWWWRINV